MRFSVLLTIFSSILLSTGAASIAATPPAEECILPDANNSKAVAEFNGKTYYFSDPACKDEFLTDPERFSQLYDALLELKATGKDVPKTPSESAVPA